MFNFAPPEIDWSIIAPTIIVAVTGILALFVEMLRPKQNNNLIVGVSLGGLIVAGASVVMQFGYGDGFTFNGMVVRDRFGLVVQLLLILSAGLSILFSEGYLREKRIPYGEFYPLLLWSTVGAMVMATTENLLLLFLGLEVLSIALYVMAGMARSETRSEESALKYFLLGSFASGFLLYGIAFLYGASGSLDIGTIGQRALAGDEATRPLFLFGLALILIGLGFKSSFVPFHQWTPDVYQGAPTNVAAFMAAGSKIGALAALWRVLDALAPLSQYWLPALFWIAILTMTVGNLLALVQKDVKRILGYSSIAHAGYVLVAILAHGKDPNVGYGTTVFYLFSYTVMTIGAFAVVSLAARQGRESTTLDDMRGLYKKAPFAVGALIVFMASLIGIPGTAGFFGKLAIFQDALRTGLTPLAIVLALNSILSIAYYLAIGKAMFVDEDPEAGEVTRPTRMNPGLTAACVLCVAGIFAGFVFFTPIIDVVVGR